MISSTRVRALTKTLRKSPRGRLIQHHYHSTQFFQTSATSDTQVPVCASVTSLHSLKGSHQHQKITSLRTNTNGINLSYIKSAPLHRWRRNFSTAIESIGIETEPADDDDNSKYAYDGVNARAEIKLNTLNETLTLANQSRSLYQKSKRTNTNTSLSLSEESLLNIHDNWKEQEVKLSDAYSKAIKYTARLRTKDVAKKAQILLDDMISRHGSIQEESNFLSKHDGPQFSDPIVMDLVNAIEQEYSTSLSASSASTSTSTSTSAKELELTRDGVPIPTSKDFANVLHSWASSKVKRKGLHAESLLYRMIELAYFYPENFSMPDSKTFGLVVKCHAGSTFKDSLPRIKRLHKIHDKLAAIDTPGITKDDPFLLMHSIKSIRNFGMQEESNLGDEWFDRLHAFVIDPLNNLDATTETENNDGDGDGNGDDNAIDLTGTYTSIIRGYAKLRRDPSAAQKAWLGLQRMQDLSEMGTTPRTCIATVDLKINAINLFLGSSSAPNDNGNGMLSNKLSLLNTLIESAMSAKKSSVSSDPLPNDQSFVGCIKALSILNDPVKVTNEAERIIAAYESLVNEKIIAPSPKVHNATIELYINIFGRDKASKGILLSICTGVSKRMERLVPSYPDIAPDTFTYMLFLKACSIDDKNPETSIERYEKAEKIFQNLESASGDSKLNDKCFFYMMKCVSNTISDPEEKKEQILGLFNKASGAGFVSADVLKMLKTNTTYEVFTQIVGNGRLPDNWVENVTSGLALYTDGTTGGAGKNARRKGKSTSNWARKQNERNESIQSRNQAKTEKKILKRERESKGKRRRR